MLKLRDGDQLYHHLVRMLKVFLCIQPGQEYVRSIVNNLLTLTYWKSKSPELPFWEAFKTNPASFNEESVELSFSLLGRSMANDSNRINIKHVQKKYRCIRRYTEAKADIATDLTHKDTMKSVSGRFKVGKDHVKVTKTREWIRGVINKARFNSYGAYNGRLAYMSSFIAQSHQANPRYATSKYPRVYRQTRGILDAMREKLRCEVENEWGVRIFGAKYRHMQPVHVGPPAQAAPIAAVAPQPSREKVREKKRRRKPAEKSDDTSDHSSNGAGNASAADDEGEESDPAPSADKMAAHQKRSRASTEQHLADPGRYRNRLAALESGQQEALQRSLDKWHESNEGTIPDNVYWHLHNSSLVLDVGGRRRAARRVNYSDEIPAEDQEFERALLASIESID